MLDNKALLTAGVAVPILYFSAVFGSALLHPDYSHISQYASELGMAGEASARWFGGGILLAGIAAVLGALGVLRATREESAGRVASGLGSIAIALFGVGLLFGAAFPMPDPRHGGYGLGMAVHLAPFLLAFALRSVPGRRSLAIYLAATGVAMILLLLPMMGVGGFVTKANVGLFQRIYALSIFVWIGVASRALMRTPDAPRGAVTPD